MLKINGDYQIVPKHFPDNSEMLLDFDLEKAQVGAKNIITWVYESDEECMTLYYIVNHIREKNINPYICLVLAYIPNARMDRVKKRSEVFTLKWFAQFINSLNFDAVGVFDPHSNVSEALFDRIRIYDVKPIITEVTKRVWKYTYPNFSGLLYYFPDDGAMKRYKDILPTSSKIIYGKKIRDWETGKIQGLEIINDNNYEIKGSIVIMIDDIISYGGTLAYSADKLRELGASNIFAYASHTENSIDDEEKGTLLKRLKDGTVSRIYTTDSLYQGKNEKIEIVELSKFVYGQR